MLGTDRLSIPRAGDAPKAPWRAMPCYRLLRLSVTDLCNFRCRYCMPADGVTRVRHQDLASYEELTWIVSWLAATLGIERVRLTGGEPLVRANLQNLVRQLRNIPALKEITLTTNGTQLPEMAYCLKQAGLDRVNISLDTLDANRFAEVTRGGSLEQTLEGIAAARSAGLTPIKLNAVLRRSTWKADVPALLDFAAGYGYEIRFIELMRTGTERDWCEREYISVDEVCHKLGLAASVVTQSAPARQLLLNWHGVALRTGWITPRSHPFCARCDRLRMDARGRLRRCLMDPRTLDLRSILSNMPSLAPLELSAYLAAKHAPKTMDNELAMIQIGG